MAGVAYSEQFFAARSAEAHVAETVLTKTFEIVGRPTSIVDLGAATGTWLHAAQRLGVSDVVGLDGAWVPKDRLLIPEADFVPIDLEADLPVLGRRFDLAICLEVLEHVSDASGSHAVDWLCRHSDIVLFSAAVPFQGGTHHINEKWPQEWAERFARNGYLAYDALRHSIWAERHVPYWYRQNSLLMMTAERGAALGLVPTDPRSLNIIHPDLYLHKAESVERGRSRRLSHRIRTFGRRIVGI